ncbi:hypothetical protein [Streptomyces canus]|uniref:hypothetical protein n=1 Tax=Streptomyces canus TaxID=58343 RepID=UPI002DD8A8CD|nr:hypothetical protein [Streptomyces canus]WSD88835.1 hypothetical protein OG925_33205 [Streptomyces canus]
MPKSVRPASVGVWVQAVPSLPIAGALLLCGVLAGRRSKGVLRGFGTVEARNWFDR